MPSLTALRATIQTILQIDTAYDLSVGTEQDRILTGANLPAIAKCLTFGTGAGKANADYWERITFPPGNTDLNLLSLSTTRGPLGNRAFSLIKYVMLRVATPVAGQKLVVGGYGANGWVGPLGDNTATHDVPSKWEDVNEIDGWPSGTTQQILRVNNPGSSSIIGDLVLIGESGAGSVDPFGLEYVASDGTTIYVTEDLAFNYTQE